MSAALLIWIVAGVVFGLSGLALIVLGIRGDPAGGRRRCPRCWYDMSGTRGLTCPECGRTAARESALHRARPRWPQAGAGLILVVLGLIVSRPYLFAWDTWSGALPLSAWEIWVPMMDPDAVALIETEGTRAVQCGPGRADQVRAAYRIMLILDGRADPAKAALTSAPPPLPGVQHPDPLSIEIAYTRRNPWTGSWLTAPSDMEFVLQADQTIDPRATAAIVMPSVRRIARDPTAPVDHRIECLRLIRAVEGDEPFRLLAAEFAVSDPSAAMRGSSLMLLSEHLSASDGSLDPWIAAVRDDNAAVRCYAIRTLRATGSRIWAHPGTRPALSAALACEDEETRRCAIEAFIIWGPRYARDAAEDIRCVASSDPVPQIRSAAAGLLERIEGTGEPP